MWRRKPATHAAALAQIIPCPDQLGEPVDRLSTSALCRRRLIMKRAHATGAHLSGSYMTSPVAVAALRGGIELHGIRLHPNAGTWRNHFGVRFESRNQNTIFRDEPHQGRHVAPPTAVSSIGSPYDNNGPFALPFRRKARAPTATRTRRFPMLRAVVCVVRASRRRRVRHRWLVRPGSGRTRRPAVPGGPMPSFPGS